MDQGYADFQKAVKRSMERVVSRKLAERVAAQRKAKPNKDDDQADRVDEVVTLADLDAMVDYLDSDNEEGIVLDANSSDDDASAVDGVDVAEEQCINHKPLDAADRGCLASIIS